MPTLTPFLWFPGNMAEVIDHYASVFRDMRIVTRSPMMATVEILGQRLHALNAPHRHQFSEALSLMIDCETQEEVDYYWSALTQGGGQEQPCGWLKDRFGVSWQVIPRALGRYLTDPDRARAARVTQAMVQMKRIVIADLDRAYDG